MTDNVTLPSGTYATKDLSGVNFPKTLLTDFNGEDVLGLLAAVPNALSVLGRLRTLADLLTTQNGYLDEVEGLLKAAGPIAQLLTTQNNYLDELEGLLRATGPLASTQATVAKQDSMITLLTALNNYVDGIEALLGASGPIASTHATDAAVKALAGASEAYAITPHDTTALTKVPKGIYVGSGGTVVLRAIGSTADVTYLNLAAGAYLAVQAQYVRASGTTAGNLIGEI